jgi:tetratricopeptide (TPR) repeat protein
LRKSQERAPPVSGGPPPEQIKGLIALYSQGQFQELLNSGASLVKQFPTAAVIYNLLGAASVGLGRLKEAEANYSKALRISPDYAEAHFNLGAAQSQFGRHENAIASYRRALRINPDYVEAHYKLGLALNAVGKLEPAIASFTRALQIRPGLAAAHYNIGVAQKALGRFEEAIGSYEKAVRIKPDFVEAHNNLGVVLKEFGKPDDAIVSYDKALQRRPNFVDALYNKGTTLKDIARYDEAIECYIKALEIKPDYAEAHNNLGSVFVSLDRHDEAIDRFTTALKIKPDYVQAYSNLCELYEKLNRVSDLEKTLSDAQANCRKEDPSILFHLARFYSRNEDHESALIALEKIHEEELSKELRNEFPLFLGKTYDKLKKYEKAFSQFARQNDITKSSFSYTEYNPDQYYNTVKTLKELWSAGGVLKLPKVHDEALPATLVFLIGFPRSGTTLLDTVLLSHPEIAVVEEEPMVRKMQAYLGRIASIEELNMLTDRDVADLRTEYFKELKNYLSTDELNKVIVDKLPLNICNVGLIHRIFPQAKFILALRHPCDCVLSCFMQNFKINEAMANFLTLDQSAKLYAAVMELWQVYKSVLDLEVSVLKYEMLIQDLRGTCAPLIEFIGLEWNDNLLNYQDTAISRGHISTPSYNQVIKPLYTQASGRWKNYREQMAPVLPILEPWIEHFGYGEAVQDQ